MLNTLFRQDGALFCIEIKGPVFKYHRKEFLEQAKRAGYDGTSVPLTQEETDLLTALGIKQPTLNPSFK